MSLQKNENCKTIPFELLESRDVPARRRLEGLDPDAGCSGSFSKALKTASAGEFAAGVLCMVILLAARWAVESSSADSASGMHAHNARTCMHIVNEPMSKPARPLPHQKSCRKFSREILKQLSSVQCMHVVQNSMRKQHKTNLRTACAQSFML